MGNPTEIYSIDPDTAVAAPEYRAQVAALCWRKGRKGKEVLLITSRDTGRWIIPKGWPMDGLSGAETAAQEAWEEAGVKPADVKKKALGSYRYYKRLSGGKIVPVRAKVYRIKVKRLADRFPEVKERTRMWVSPKKAAKLVKEPKLKKLLRQF